jgi:hypothetical protein
VQRNGHIWRGKFVVTVLLGRYLNDAASFCDVRTAWQARTWLPNSATMNTRLASGVADFCTIAAMVCLTRPAPVDHELSTMIY